MPAELTLAHDRAGRGEPLVLVHPLGADRAVWEPVMGLLSPCHDTIAVDMPGFGGSPETGPDDPPTPARTARAIVSTLDELGIEHAHVAGISLGGWAALEFGTTGRCLSVTGLCTAGFWNRPLGPRPEVARSAALGLVRLARPLLLARRVRNLALRGVVRHPERVPADAAYRLVRAYALSPGFVRANAEMRKALFSGFEHIPVPVSLAWSEYDRLVAPPRRGVPRGVETTVLRDCGHIPTWDDPQQVANVILAGAARAADPARELSA